MRTDQLNADGEPIRSGARDGHDRQPREARRRHQRQNRRSEGGRLLAIFEIRDLGRDPGGCRQHDQRLPVVEERIKGADEGRLLCNRPTDLGDAQLRGGRQLAFEIPAQARPSLLDPGLVDRPDLRAAEDALGVANGVK